MNLLSSLGYANAHINGILDISRCQYFHSFSATDDLSSCCDNEEILVTYFCKLLCDSNCSDDGIELENVRTEQGSERPQWHSTNMLLTQASNHCLLGPEPLIFLEFVNSEQFHPAPLSSISDWSTNIPHDHLKWSDKLEIHENCNLIDSKSFHSPLNEYFCTRIGKVNNKMSLSVQETLREAASLEEAEVTQLRRLFFASSYPSRYLNLQGFCLNLCEAALGETNYEKQKDYFRYVLTRVIVKI